MSPSSCCNSPFMYCCQLQSFGQQGSRQGDSSASQLSKHSAVSAKHHFSQQAPAARPCFKSCIERPHSRNLDSHIASNQFTLGVRNHKELQAAKCVQVNLCSWCIVLIQLHSCQACSLQQYPPSHLMLQMMMVPNQLNSAAQMTVMAHNSSTQQKQQC